MYVHWGVKNVVSDDFFNSKKGLKWEKAEIKRSFRFLYDMRLFFCYLLGESWQDVLHICVELMSNMLHGVALVNYSERDKIV